jgi:hypothetical protein
MRCEYSKEKFWKVCLQIARNQPRLCAEEVEFKAVLQRVGLALA